MGGDVRCVPPYIPLLLASALEASHQHYHVGYGPVNQALKDKTQFPFSYRLIPKQEPHHLGMIKLLWHFKWTWVSLLTTDNDKGERFTRTFTDLMIRNGLCVASSKSIPELDLSNGPSVEKKGVDLIEFLLERQVNVTFYQLNTQAMIYVGAAWMVIDHQNKPILEKVWIAAITDDSVLTMIYNSGLLRFIHGSLTFLRQTQKKADYGHYQSLLLSVNQFGMNVFPCSYSKPALSMKGWLRCREEETQQALTPEVVGRFLSYDGSNVYGTVQAVIHALQVALSSRLTWRAIADSPHQMMQSWQLHPFLQHLRMNLTSMEGVYLDADGDLATDFDLLNFVLLPNNSFSGVKVGSFERDNTQEIKFSIDQKAIVWPRRFKQVGNSTELLECVL
ncbi:hypothetical protein lerEdw1_015878 [Lerista edwardsae]|nr:hypothetical protein lerEdw1_015878 [Lerista edwardsae]